MINGTKRGLFSNEAGQGTAPNAAATATVSHPVRQGHRQNYTELFITRVSSEQGTAKAEAPPAA